MATGNNKELIDDIASKLRDNELPYREGAWERFSALENSRKRRVLWPYWSAAAVLLAVGASYLTVRNNATVEHPQVAKLNTVVEKPAIIFPDSAAIAAVESNLGADKGAASPTTTERRPTQSLLIENTGHEAQILAYSPAHSLQERATPVVDLGELISLGVKQTQGKVSPSPSPAIGDLTAYPMLSNIKNEEPDQKLTISTLGALERSHTLGLANNPVNGPTMGRKWELGAFVSPASSNDEMSMGGGLSVAYNLTKKLSVRSGVALQNYQMAMALNPIQNAPASMDAPAKGNAFLTDVVGNSARMNPNFTAVSGSVLTLDIPVEMKYNFTRTFYTSVGMSMVSVLQQSRVNHYVENISANTFKEGSSASSNTGIQAVNRTIKSDQENVNTDGFNGFINLSIGRKLPLKKSFSISVEPFYRVPLGQFRSADGNYSNGGVKVITNF